MSKASFGFSVFGNQYFFTPKFTILTVGILIVLLGLGIWQWKAAADVHATIDLINERLALDPLTIDDLDKGGDLRFYPVQIQGSFDDEHSILIKDRMFKGQRGFQVLTPFKPMGAAKEILVNRGWIPEFPIGKMPDFGNIPDGVTIFGILFQPHPGSMSSAFDENNITWPLIIKNPEIETIGKVLGSPMYPYIVLLSPSSPYGFVREWVWLMSATTPDRHKAYAKQSFALALTILLAFLFLNIQRIE